MSCSNSSLTKEIVPALKTQTFFLYIMFKGTSTFGTSQFPYVGQNLAMSMGTRAPSSTRSYDSIIQSWYDEVKDFPPGNVGSYSKSGATGIIGHYTQVS